MLDDKEKLESLYAQMSLSQMARHLGVARSTLYSKMRKLGIGLRTKGEAQRKFLSENDAPMLGKRHSAATKTLISKYTQEFWDSDRGQDARKKIADVRRQEWQGKSKLERRMAMAKLTKADRPQAGELSKFGQLLFSYLAERGDARQCVDLIGDHASDIILDKEKIVIEIVLPMATYGTETQQQLQERYEDISQRLNMLGYRVLVIEDISNSLSQARCRRIHEVIRTFTEKNLIIQS